MLFATPPRPRLCHLALLALLLVAGGLASSCQSSRPSFSFQPGPGLQPRHEASSRAPAPNAPAAPSTAAAQAEPAAPSNSPPAAPNRRRNQSRHRLAAIAAIPGAARPAARPAAPHRRTLLARPHAAAEAGLGTTVLGVLGLVVLPIALLGLLLSGGGLVWGVVAGAAALAVLVAYLDPFGQR